MEHKTELFKFSKAGVTINRYYSHPSQAFAFAAECGVEDVSVWREFNWVRLIVVEEGVISEAQT